MIVCYEQRSTMLRDFFADHFIETRRCCRAKLYNLRSERHCIKAAKEVPLGRELEFDEIALHFSGSRRLANQPALLLGAIMIVTNSRAASASG
jgi:hypothetical protein